MVAEGFAIPLLSGAWLTARVFSLGNALLLGVRIRGEDRALASTSVRPRAPDERSDSQSPR